MIRTVPIRGRTGKHNAPFIWSKNGAPDIKALDVWLSANAVNIQGITLKRGVTVINSGVYGLSRTDAARLALVLNRVAGQRARDQALEDHRRREPGLYKKVSYARPRA